MSLNKLVFGRNPTEAEAYELDEFAKQTTLTTKATALSLAAENGSLKSVKILLQCIHVLHENWMPDHRNRCG